MATVTVTDDPVCREVLSLSAGTVAGLIGDPRYAAIDAARFAFLEWYATGASRNQGTWMAAWDAFAASGRLTPLP